MNYLSVYNHIKNNGGFIKLLFELYGRPYTMSRVPTDPVGSTLKRISLSVSKATSKNGTKKKKMDQNEKANDATEIRVKLFNKKGECVDNEVPNIEAWSEGNVLQIEDSKFLVELNTPIVHRASIPSVVMAGFPVVPTLMLEFAHKANSEYKWFKQKVVTEDLAPESGETTDDVENKSESKWTEVGQGLVYVPTIEDIDHTLKMTCKAGSHDKKAHTWYSVVASTNVTAGPGYTPFESRQLYTSKPLNDPSVFRVVSYNILADCYLEDEATCEAWFGYCPKYALAIDYRQQLLLKEILGYNGDIVCLQECGRHLYEGYLNPVMKSKGYTGVVMYKTGVMPEGEAIFVKDSKFRLVSQHDIVIKDYFLSDASCGNLLKKVEHVPQVFEKISSRSTVAQLAVLQCVEHPEDYICLVNTHLYFRPSVPFIRNLQAMTLLNLLNEMFKKLESDLKQNSMDNSNIGVVFCGDMNSLPESGVVQLMCKGKLESHHPDWILSEEPGQAINFLEMSPYSHQFDFQNCCGFPEFTTYTEGFKGVIDYIFASKKMFDVQAVIPMPPAEELQVYTAIPSPVMPSDHLALICELKWKQP